MDTLRNQIDQRDRELLSVLAKRSKLVSKLAKIKKENHLPIRQNNREKEMLAKRILWAKKLNISQTCIRSIFHAIFRDSRNCQKKSSMPIDNSSKF
ncbi:chorismate mutase [Candidatus Peregrinibacteria bacterium]|nr:chorismate mutase [Candidatus Peregrinibacteria bacterium]